MVVAIGIGKINWRVGLKWPRVVFRNLFADILRLIAEMRPPEFWNLQQALASSPEPFAMSCQLNLQCDAAILLQSDRIGADVNAIAAQIPSCPQIKRAIVKRTQDGCSTNEAVGKRSSPMRAIRLRREYLARAGVVNGDVSTVHLEDSGFPLGDLIHTANQNLARHLTLPPPPRGPKRTGSRS